MGLAPEKLLKLKAAADHVLLPCSSLFELLVEHGIAATYEAGHPLANVIPMQPTAPPRAARWG